MGRLDETGVADLLGRSTLCVVPSLWYENMPNTLLESWAAGTPVLASDIGSLHDMVFNSGAGGLFEVGDAGSLAHAALNLLSDPSSLRQMSARALELIRTKYSPQAHVRALEDVLRAAVARGGK